MWYREHIGGDRIPVVDTWWQTETGGIMIAPLPGVTTLKPGSATKPLPGIGAVGGRRGGQPGRARRRRLRDAHQAVAGDAARHLGRRRALQGDVLEQVRRPVLRRRRRAHRRGRLLLVHGPRRRRHERRRSPHLAPPRWSRRSSIIPAVAEAAVVAKSDPRDRTGDLGVRDAARRLRGVDRARSPSCATTSPS